MSLIYTSDNSTNGFDATTLNSLPSGWTAVSGTWAVKNTAANLISAHVHDFEDTSQGASSIDDTALYTGNGTAADMDVTFAQVVPVGGYSGGNLTSLGCYVRSDIANSNGYLFIFGQVAGLQCLLFKKVGGSLTGIGTAVAMPFTPAAGQIILTRFQCIGTAIRAKIWLSTGAEPTSWTISATDGSITAAGYAGLRVTQQVASVQANCSDFNVDSIASSSDNLTTLAPTSIAASGGNMTVSGTYSGTAPTAADLSIDGGSYAALSGFSASAGVFSGTVAAPAGGIHSLDVRDHNNTTHTDAGIYIVTVPATTAIAPNDAGLVYSPYNWNVTSTHAITVQPGAYFKTLFTGNTCVLNFDTSHMQSPASQIWWRIDDSKWVSAAVAATVSLTIPAVMSGNSDVPCHLLEVIYKGQDPSGTANSWDPASTGTAVNFTGLTIDYAASVAAPAVLSRNILVYGDSITEGVRTAGESASPTPGQNDAQMGWAYQLGKLLGAEVGVVGCGGTGYTNSYRGVPACSSSYNLIYSGQSRTFSPAPDLTVVNHGVNDGGASGSSITTAATTVFNGLLGAFAAKPIVALAPLPPSYSGASTVRSAIQTAITNIGNARLSWVDTPGVFNTAKGADSLSVHPSGPNNQGLIAPAIAELLRSSLYPATGGSPVGGFVIGG